MSTHNIGFYEDLTKIIFQLSSNIIKYAPYLFFYHHAQADLNLCGTPIENFDGFVIQRLIMKILLCRRYSRWFGTRADAGPQLSSYCLQNYKIWEEKIEAWQNRVLDCK